MVGVDGALRCLSSYHSGRLWPIPVSGEALVASAFNSQRPVVFFYVKAIYRSNENYQLMETPVYF